MAWYGIEPLVAGEPQKALALGVAAKIPLIRQFVARRNADAAAAMGEKGDLTALVAALGSTADPEVQADLLQGAREGLRGRQRMPVPGGWPGVYRELVQSGASAVREHAVMLALVFGDPQAVVDLRRIARTPTVPPAERQAALEALISSATIDLAPLLHELLTDKALRRAALRGLA